MTNAELRREYNRYNRKYFRGRLPKLMVHFTKMPKYYLGLSTYVGRPSGGSWAEIEISKVLKCWPKLTRCVLLHEMVHVSLPQQVIHGSKFEKGMRKLAKAGAFTGLW